MKILIAWWFFFTNSNNALAQKRLKICSECEMRKWFVCGVCNCPLNMKARLPDEPCPHPNGDKWKVKSPASNVNPGFKFLS